jgi:FHS family Na+ dependent glucose MFS transporter 1
MAALLNSAFWGALTAGRLLSIPLAMRFSARRILQGDLLVCLLSLGVLLLWPSSLAATWTGTLGLGVGMASIFPTTITLAEQRMTITGQVTSLFFVGSSLGGMVLPWLIGQVFEPFGPPSMVVLVLVDLLVALALYLMLIFRVHAAPVENPA